MNKFVENELTLTFPVVGKSSKHVSVYIWFVFQVMPKHPPLPSQGVELAKAVGVQERWRHLLLPLLSNEEMWDLFLTALESKHIRLLSIMSCTCYTHLCVNWMWWSVNTWTLTCPPLFLASFHLRLYSWFFLNEYIRLNHMKLLIFSYYLTYINDIFLWFSLI